MLYGFKIAPSLNQGEPTKAYFEGLQHHAADVLRTKGDLDAGQAFRLCEYLDAVDSRAMDSVPALYQSCLSKLLAYLASANKAQIAKLIGRSWAAHTCNELTGASLEPVPLRVLHA